MITFLLLIYTGSAITILNRMFKTNGLNPITIDISNYISDDEFQVSVVMEVSQKSKAYLAYCYGSQDEIKNAYKAYTSSKQLLITDIRNCVFDYFAAALDLKVQGLTLYTHLKDEQEYRVFSVYPLRNSTLSLYIFSSQDSDYLITITAEGKRASCYRGCNQGGSCHNSSNLPSFCICEANRLDSLCNHQMRQLQLQSRNTIMMPGNTLEYLALLKIEEIKSSISLEIKSTQNVKFQIGCYYSKSPPYFDINVILSEGTIEITRANMINCMEWTKNTAQAANLQEIQPKYLVLMQNENMQAVEIVMKVTLDSSAESNEYLIYYIFGSIASVLLVALIIIIVYINKQRQSQRIQQIQDRLKVQQKKFSLKTKPQQDCQKYHEIIAIYPGLAETNECLICLGEFQPEDIVKLTHCIHLFHDSCLKEWTQRNMVYMPKSKQTCPFCRESIDKLHEEKYVDIVRMGVIVGDQEFINHENEDIQRRISRIKKLKEAASPSPFADTTPGSGMPLKLQLFRDKNHLAIQ